MSERPKQIQDIMSRRVATLTQDEDVQLVESAMQRYHFRHIPVVEGERLVGLVTHRDLLRFGAGLVGGARVRDVMSVDVTTVAPDMAISDAARLMLMKKADCMPVTDAEERLLGIVTASDFLSLAISLLEH